MTMTRKQKQAARTRRQLAEEPISKLKQLQRMDAQLQRAQDRAIANALMKKDSNVQG